MSNTEKKAVTPLTPEEAQQVEQQEHKDGWFHRDAVAVDVAANVIVFGGLEGQTMSSASAIEEENTTHGFKHEVTHVLNEALDLIEPNHGARAAAADLERGKRLKEAEENSGLLPKEEN